MSRQHFIIIPALDHWVVVLFHQAKPKSRTLNSLWVLGKFVICIWSATYRIRLFLSPGLDPCFLFWGHFLRNDFVENKNVFAAFSGAEYARSGDLRTGEIFIHLRKYCILWVCPLANNKLICFG